MNGVLKWVVCVAAGSLFLTAAAAPALFSCGLRDAICPPSGIFAAFNRLGELHDDPAQDKAMAVYPYNHHEGGDAHQTTNQLSWLNTRFRTPNRAP